MFKQLRSYFVSGLLILAPLFLTVLVLLYLVRLAAAFVVNPIFRLLPVELDLPSRVLLAKVAIALAVIVFVTALGFTARKFIFRRFLAGAESVILGVPVFSKLYRSFKDIAQAMFGGKTGVFKRVVFFQYPNVGVYTMGFVTSESFAPLSEKTGEECVTVFVPSPPNPTTGYSVLVPKKSVIDSDMTVEDGIKYCISCGVAVPAKK
jgi:uncharacterized membrane protein